MLGCETLPDSDKKLFLKAKSTIENASESSDEDFREAEMVLCGFVDQIGHLVLHGDLLSVASAESAITLRNLWRFVNVMHGVLVGKLLRPMILLYIIFSWPPKEASS